MTLSLEQFRERIVDYLYGELKAEERTAFEACLAESEACRHELETMRETLQLARSGLANLEEAPPPRISRAVLEFAAQQPASSESAELAEARVHSAAAPRTRAEPSETASPRGFFAWLRNPGFITAAGFATIALLALLTRKSVLAPQRDFAVPPAPTAAPSDKREAEPAARSLEERDPEPEIREPSNARKSAATESVREGAPPASTGAPAAKRAAPGQRAPDAIGGLGAARSAPEPARRAAPAPRKYAEPPPAWKSSQPPPSAASEAAKPAAAPALDDEEPLDGLAPLSESPATPSLARPQAASGAAQSRTTRAREAKDHALERSSADEAKASSDRAAPPPSAAAPASAANISPYAPNDLVQKAREHLSQGRPREAALAFRDLLKRFPRDPRATDWRKQLDLANRALNAP